MNKKRVVITGIGVISPIGIGKDAYWESLNRGKQGFKNITLFDTGNFTTKIGGEITEFAAENFIGSKGLVDLDRATRLLLSATKLALDDSQLDITGINDPVTGISVGTTFGSLHSLSVFDRQSIEEGPNFVNPSRFPNLVINSPASRNAIRYAVKGPNATVSTGFCSGLDAIDYAVNTINSGRARRMIVGAVEEMCIETFLGFHKLRYLSGLDGKEPISCPFDQRRNGIIYSEGASVIIIEELDTARERRAPIYAEILGMGSNFGKGGGEAMTLALKDATLGMQNIDCIFASANSTKFLDSTETKAIKEVFNSRAKNIPVSAIKSMLGETLSAAGGLATVAALGSLQKDFIPPTINFLEGDPEDDLDYVPNKARGSKVNSAMINAFSPSGASTVLIVGRYQ
ncbi:MAG: beta-ketoacyl-[acyl-carrier-protein] synthase family protein [bacterium]|nr:beta-ketoacyl-[acyl-carrier-protein] synthase family protein [bacterium]